MTPTAVKLGKACDLLQTGGRRALSTLHVPARLAYIGSQHQDNLGDGVMYNAAAKLLQDFRLVAWRGHRMEQRLQRCGLSGTPYFRGTVLGGGTLINPYWAEDVRLALRQGLRVWSLGTGVGNCGFEQADEVELGEWAPLLRQFSGVGVRGPLSRDRLEALGVPRVQVVGDLALVLARDRCLEPADRPAVAVNLALPHSEERQSGERRLLPELESVLKTLIRAGWRVVPVAMTSRDVEALQSLLHSATGESVQVEICSNAEALLDTIAPCRFTIAVRLHAAILSACVGVPPLMLGYRDKCLDFMASVELEQWHLSTAAAAPGELEALALRLAETPASLRGELLGRVHDFRARLRDYFAEIVKLLAKG